MPREGGGGTTFAASAAADAAGLSRVARPAETDGGGCTTVGTGRAGEERTAEPDTPEGGGGTTFVAMATRVPPARNPAPAEAPPVTVGGGGTTVVANELGALRGELPPLTEGGGGTTDALPDAPPNTRSSRLLMNEVFAAGAGGGGTIDFERSGKLPVDSRRRSWDISAEGGGATTDGAGMVSLELRPFARSGAETGGGTTAAFVICTGEREISRLTAGAGGTTPGLRAGARRARSREMSRVRLGAGATTLVASAGATRV